MHETLVPIDDQVQQVLALHQKRIENKQRGIFTESVKYGRNDRLGCIDLVHLGTVKIDHCSISFWLQRRKSKQSTIEGHILRSSTPLVPGSSQTLITRRPLGERPWDSDYARTLVPIGLDDVLATFAM